jgi:hypothetical protein
MLVVCVKSARIIPRYPAGLTDAERYVLSRVREHEPLSWMHRRVLWRLAERGVPIVLDRTELFPDLVWPDKPLRRYGDLLTADVNNKGVLDVDTVKGCTAGMNARPGTGCYYACYAASIAKFRGIDFSVAVTRTVQSGAQRQAIEQAVASAPHGFFRIGTMGDPCHAWEETVRTVEWLSEFARPVIITKHWMRASDEQFQRLIACRTVLNTSVSALDTPAELAHRTREFYRFKVLGGDSVARVISCAFNRAHPEGARMGAIQDELFRLKPTLDNPLRVPRTYPLAVQGIISLTVTKDLEAERTISLENPATYLGHCRGCPDVCGIALVESRNVMPQARQMALWHGA